MHRLDFTAHRLLGFKLTAYLTNSIFCSILVGVLISLSVTTYSSMKQGTSETINNEEQMNVNDHLEKIELYVGSGTEVFYSNDYVLLGIVSNVLKEDDSLDSKLRNLGLEWKNDSTVETNRIINDAKSVSMFKPLQKIDKTKIDRESSYELDSLRRQYGNVFGPGLFFSSGGPFGILTNKVKVGFVKNVSEERISELLKSHGAIEIRFLPQFKKYLVEFPNSIGYNILDKCSAIFALKEVNYVENEYRVIESNH